MCDQLTLFEELKLKITPHAVQMFNNNDILNNSLSMIVFELQSYTHESTAF